MIPLFLLDSVKFSYAQQSVMDIQHLVIPYCNIVTLLGENGAGKSTLLKLLGFQIRPTHGNIRFSGLLCTKQCEGELRRRVILVDQKPYLFKGTVFENVALGLQFRSCSRQKINQKVNEILQRVSILQIKDSKVSEISGGEAQKVALARAMVLEPEVLLLDEPFSHLDQRSVEQMSKLLINFAKADNRTVIFSAHDQKFASSIADKRIYLNAGKVDRIESMR